MDSLGNGSIPTAQFGTGLCGNGLSLQKSLDCSQGGGWAGKGEMGVKEMGQNSVMDLKLEASHTL